MKQLITVFLRSLPIFALITICTGTAFAAESKYRRTVEKYTVPDVVLTDQNGRKVPIKEFLNPKDTTVVVEFIFGTCTTICPILSAGYVNLQQKLGADLHKAKLVSISIDPEHDTPKVMKEYLKRYRAKPGWDFFTGSRDDIDKVMNAFNAYIPNKMSHFPLTLIRKPADGSWVRIYGLLSSSEFFNEFNKVGTK